MLGKEGSDELLPGTRPLRPGILLRSEVNGPKREVDFPVESLLLELGVVLVLLLGSLDVLESLLELGVVLVLLLGSLDVLALLLGFGVGLLLLLELLLLLLLLLVV